MSLVGDPREQSILDEVARQIGRLPYPFRWIEVPKSELPTDGSLDVCFATGTTRGRRPVWFDGVAGVWKFFSDDVTVS